MFKISDLFDSSLNLIEQLNHSFTVHSEKTAIEEDCQKYTYEELRKNVHTLAEMISGLNSQYVAVIGEPSFSSVVSVLGTVFSGCVYVPVDPSWPIERIKRILKNCQAKVLVHSLPAKEKIGLDFSSLPLQHFISIQQTSCEEEKPVVSKETQVIPFHLHSSGKNLYDLPKKENCDICYIMHTSGSSGEPKGVKVTFEAFQHFLTWVKKDFQITEKDRFAHTSTLGFGASLRQIFSPFLSGSTLVCFHPLVLKSPRALLENLKKKKITVFNAPPVILKKMAQAASLLPSESRSLPSIRWVLAGGDLFPSDTLKKWYENFHHNHSVANLYGSTESLVNASSYKTTFGFDSYSHSFLPVGKPRPGFSFLILDENNNPIAENNRSGALFMDSLFVSSGYHENPEETGRVFPVIGGKRLYNTGDLALRLPSGDYLVLGRSEDRQVQIYGQRVELSEIENLLNNHPSVQRAFVVDVEIEDWHGIFSYIQPIPNEPGLSVSESSSDFSFLKNYLKKFLPAYMIPYDFEIMEQVEATHFQKVDYKTLRQKARQKYLSFRKEKTQGLDSSVISQIKDIWSQHLQKESIDIHQSFFDAGGDSIMAVEIYQSLCERFNVRLDPFVFYKSPTIYKLALAMIETGNKNPSTDEATKIFLSSSSQKKGIYKFSPQQFAFKIVLKFFKLINKIRPYFYQSKNMKTAPQSPQQKYFIYIKQLLGEQYNGCFSVPITGSVDLEQLKKVLDLTIASQESLRTVFIGDKQVILNKYSSEVLFYDLTHEDSETKQKIILEINRKLLYKNFDFSNLPLFRVVLFKKSERHFVFTVCVNHIIVDGWSLQIFLSLLNQYYGFFENKTDLINPVSYAEYTLKYKRFCRKRYAVNKLFWEERFPKINRCNASPKMEERDASPQEEGLILGQKEIEFLKESIKKYNSPSFYIFMALWAKAFSRLIECSEISFFITYHNRSFAFKELQNMIGSVARMAPLAIDILPTDSFETILHKTKEAYFGVLNYCDFNVFSPGRNDKYSVVAFNYLDFSRLSAIANHFPFKMDVNQAEVRLSRSQKGYRYIHLFLSVHEYLNHIRLQIYGKGPRKHKFFLLNSIKDEVSKI